MTLEKALYLRDTVNSIQQDKEGRVHFGTMACHKSIEGKEYPCVGYAFRVGYGDAGLRILHSMGLFFPEDLQVSEDEIHPDLDTMFRALFKVRFPEFDFDGYCQAHPR